MKKERKNKGITLIALIITIIVMLILVGVTVNVALNGGLFDAAKQAASGMNMAQIKEKAEIAKTVLMADMETDKTIMGVRAEYLKRLQADLGGEIEDNKLVVQDRKYDIIVKNADLDIEVVEHSDNIAEPSSLPILNCETNNTNENKINIEFTISSAMTLSEYTDSLKAQEDCEALALAWFSNEYAVGEYYGVETTFLEVIIAEINRCYDKTYTSIEECLEDENVQAEWGTTEEQVYYYWWNMYSYEENESHEITIEELVEMYISKYAEEYFNNYTKNLRLFVSKDGGAEEEIQNGIDISTEDKTISYEVEENGTYEFVVKTNSRRVITNEIFEINSL